VPVRRLAVKFKAEKGGFMLKLLSVTGVVLLLASCTPYQQSGFMGGYDETQLSENMFSVNFRGNAYVSSSRAEDYTHLRSAEVTLENGFRYFAIVDSNSQISSSSYSVPTTATTTGSALTTGNVTNFNANTTYSGGGTYSVSKPNAKNTIVCFKEKQNNIMGLFDAVFVSKSLRKKYDLDKSASPDESKTEN
jgi:hypothetical protein